ncbi:hypothetical protein [Maridesulfovibrio sp.]|uniref:hypothetical protein n=1 Tax=Maridesulfovibrio sp. TaxID=2795000 RepID=UPI002A186EC5|nr:hypothetical protein [Maridesulfovibrio sp.]
MSLKLRYPRCVAFIISITCQLSLYICITVAIAIYFCSAFQEILNQSYFPVSVNSTSVPELFSYLNKEMNVFLKPYSSKEHVLGKVNSNEALIKYDGHGFTIINAEGKIENFRNTGRSVNFNVVQRSWFNSTDFRSRYEHSSKTYLNLIDVRGAEVAYFVYEFLQKNTNIVVKVKFEPGGLYEVLSKSSITKKSNSKYRFKDHEHGHDMIVQCRIEIPRQYLQYHSKKIGEIIDNAQVLTNIQKVALFSPLINYDNVLVKSSPLLITFTVAFGFLVTVFGAYIKEKIKFAYVCNKHCFVRVLFLILLPVVAVTSLYEAYIYYLPMRISKYKIFDVLDNDMPPLRELAWGMLLPIITIAFVYLVSKFLLQLVSENKKPQDIWQSRCLEYMNESSSSKPEICKVSNTTPAPNPKDTKS